MEEVAFTEGGLYVVRLPGHMRGGSRKSRYYGRLMQVLRNGRLVFHVLAGPGIKVLEPENVIRPEEKGAL